MINVVLFVPAAVLLLIGGSFFNLRASLKETPDAKKNGRDALFGGIGFLSLGILILGFAVAGLFAGEILLMPLIIAFAVLSLVFFIAFLIWNARSNRKN